MHILLHPHILFCLPAACAVLIYRARRVFPSGAVEALFHVIQYIFKLAYKLKGNGESFLARTELIVLAVIPEGPYINIFPAVLADTLDMDLFTAVFHELAQQNLLIPETCHNFCLLFLPAHLNHINKNANIIPHKIPLFTRLVKKRRKSCDLFAAHKPEKGAAVVPS